MINKIDFSSAFWVGCDTKLISDLIKKLTEKEDNDSVILDIDDVVRENDERMPVLYGITPYIVEIAAEGDIKKTKKIWNYLGCWVYNQSQFRIGIDEPVLKYFDESLKFAEMKLCEILLEDHKLNETELESLYTCLFAFAGHDFGCMVVDTFRDYEEGYATAKCKNGHLSEFAIYDNGIFFNKQNRGKKEIPAVSQSESEYPFEKEQANKWRLFVPQIEKAIQTESSLAIKSHLKTAVKIMENGITVRLPMRFAFSVYGSLLYCNGCMDCANRFFHAWDKVICPVCGEEYVFADYWCHSY